MNADVGAVLAEVDVLLGDNASYPCTRCGEDAADAPGALCVECFDDDQEADDAA